MDERGVLLHYLNVRIEKSQIFVLEKDINEFWKSVRRLVEINPVLEMSDLKLLITGIKNIVLKKRESYRQVSAVLVQDSVLNSHYRYSQVESLLKSISSEISQFCQDVISLFTENLLKVIVKPDMRVMSYKTIADNCRYISESTEKEFEKEQWIKRAEQNYNSALMICGSEIKPESPISLGLALNYTVFLYEILGKPNDAIILAQQTFANALDRLDSLSEDELAESQSILFKIISNYNHWNSV